MEEKKIFVLELKGNKYFVGSIPSSIKKQCMMTIIDSLNILK